MVDKEVWLTFVACYNTVVVIFLASGGHYVQVHVICNEYYDVLKFSSFSMFVKGRSVGVFLKENAVRNIF